MIYGVVMTVVYFRCSRLVNKPTVLKMHFRNRYNTMSHCYIFLNWSMTRCFKMCSS